MSRSVLTTAGDRQAPWRRRRLHTSARPNEICKRSLLLLLLLLSPSAMTWYYLWEENLLPTLLYKKSHVITLFFSLSTFFNLINRIEEEVESGKFLFSSTKPLYFCVYIRKQFSTLWYSQLKLVFPKLFLV